MTGRKTDPIVFQRAAGWCEAVPKFLCYWPSSSTGEIYMKLVCDGKPAVFGAAIVGSR